jgi:hypothetical protein
MYRVIVSNNDQEVAFAFNHSSDALRFAETCLECGDEGTTVTIKEQEEE